MTDKTRTELVQEALQLLVPLASGDYATADVDYVDGKVESLVASLNEEGTTYLGDTDNYPLAQFQYIAICLAGFCLHNFGLAVITPPNVEAAKSALRLINSAPSSRAVLAVDYF